jgi:hypothetical protein
LAPAWEGMELGIGDGVLVKALANSTGRSTQQIKADMQRTGDLGVVAETSKGSQRTMFQVPTCFRLSFDGADKNYMDEIRCCGSRSAWIWLSWIRMYI